MFWHSFDVYVSFSLLSNQIFWTSLVEMCFLHVCVSVWVKGMYCVCSFCGVRCRSVFFCSSILPACGDIIELQPANAVCSYKPLTLRVILKAVLWLNVIYFHFYCTLFTMFNSLFLVSICTLPQGNPMNVSQEFVQSELQLYLQL